MYAFLEIRGIGMREYQTKGRYILRYILTGVFVYLLLQVFYLCFYLLPSAADKTDKSIIFIFLVQSVFFAAAIFSIMLVLISRYQESENPSPYETVYIITGDGKIKNRFLLQGRQSFIITGKPDGKEVFIEDYKKSVQGRYIYGVCNLVAGVWYIEAFPGSRLLGIRKGGEGVIYRLKEELPYMVSCQDIIYAGTCKITMEQKYQEEAG